MPTRNELLSASRKELATLMQSGHPIAPGALDETEYRGTSLGLPAWVERLTWKTFRKTFHRDPATGALRGWNVRLLQRGRGGRAEPILRGGVPVTFGHYVVVEERPVEDGPGLLLHYGLGKNGRLDPVRLLRDPLVALEAGSAELLLGFTYLEAGPVRIGTPSFFTLEREGPLTYRPPV